MRVDDRYVYGRSGKKYLFHTDISGKYNLMALPGVFIFVNVEASTGKPHYLYAGHSEHMNLEMNSPAAMVVRSQSGVEYILWKECKDAKERKEIYQDIKR